MPLFYRNYANQHAEVIVVPRDYIEGVGASRDGVTWVVRLDKDCGPTCDTSINIKPGSTKIAYTPRTETEFGKLVLTTDWTNGAKQTFTMEKNPFSTVKSKVTVQIEQEGGGSCDTATLGPLTTAPEFAADVGKPFPWKPLEPGTGNAAVVILSSATPEWLPPDAKPGRTYDCFHSLNPDRYICEPNDKGTGKYPTSQQCTASCKAAPTFDCNISANGPNTYKCVQTDTGTGKFPTMQKCQDSCKAPPDPTFDCVISADGQKTYTCVQNDKGTGKYPTMQKCTDNCKAAPDPTFDCDVSSNGQKTYTCVQNDKGTGKFPTMQKCTDSCVSPKPHHGCVAAPTQEHDTCALAPGYYCELVNGGVDVRPCGAGTVCDSAACASGTCCQSPP